MSKNIEIKLELCMSSHYLADGEFSTEACVLKSKENQGYTHLLLRKCKRNMQI